MQIWPNNLPPPVFPSMNDELARIMSAMTKDGRVPTYEEAQAALYAREQGPCEPVANYNERRG